MAPVVATMQFAPLLLAVVGSAAEAAAEPDQVLAAPALAAAVGSDPSAVGLEVVPLLFALAVALIELVAGLFGLVYLFDPRSSYSCCPLRAEEACDYSEVLLANKLL